MITWTRADVERLSLVIILLLAAGAVLRAAPAWWHSSIIWCLQHRVLLPASGHPMVTLPAASGAGLDFSRLAVVVGGLLIVAAVAVPAAIAWVRTREVKAP